MYYFYKKLLFICLFVCSSFAVYAENNAKLQEARELMLSMQLQFHTDKQLSALRKLSLSKDPKIKEITNAIKAQIDAEIFLRLQKALNSLLPYVAKDQALPKKKNTLNFPMVKTWQMDHPISVIAAARILRQDNKYSLAIQILSQVPIKKGLAIILATEEMGNISTALRNYKKSIEFYEISLSYIDALKYEIQYLDISEKTMEILKKRLTENIKIDQEILAIQHYGAAFAAYRSARASQLEGNFLLGAVKFTALIKDYPKTIYSEAATLYRGGCLFHLYTKKENQKAKKQIAQLAKSLTKNKLQFKNNKKKMFLRFQQVLESRILKKTKLIELMVNIPLGEKAADSAIAELTEFYNSNKLGAYRGMAMQLIAEHELENNLDRFATKSALDKVSKWIISVDKQSELIAKFPIPKKALGVTQPPPSTNALTGWSKYIAPAEIKSSQIINRFNTHWYLTALKARNAKLFSFLFYLENNQEEALKAARFIIKYEPLERQFYENQEANSYSRLVKYYKRGWLLVPPKELKFFKKDSKLYTGVILGDFYFATAQEKRCIEIRKNLLDEKYGKTSREQKAILTRHLAEAYARHLDSESAQKVLQPFREGFFKGTFGNAVGILCIANLLSWEDSKRAPKTQYSKEIIELYKTAVKSAKRQKYKDNALYFLADTYKIQKKKKEAIKIYKQLLKQNPKTPWGNLAKKGIRESLKIKTNQKGKNKNKD